MADKNIYWSKTGLTGGAATDLDSIDGTALQDGEIAHVWISNVLYIYLLDVDSGAAESSPAIIAPATNAGDKRWILQSYYSGSGTLYTDHIAESTAAHGVEIDGLTIKDSGFALGSDADGDMYYRASSVLARLAKGTDNYKLFMNAAGTAPEWAVGQAIITGTRLQDADDGTIAYTGVGFKPNCIIALAECASLKTWSIGLAVANDEHCLYNYVAAPDIRYAGGYLIYSRESTPANLERGWVTAYGSDGFSLTWQKGGTPTSGTINLLFLCFR